MVGRIRETVETDPLLMDVWVEGEAFVERKPISFLGYVDEGGEVVDPTSPHKGQNISGKVLIFPSARGSTVGSYVLVSLSVVGKAPGALVMTEPSTVVLSGAIVAGIPLVYGVPEEIVQEVETGDFIRLNPLRGEVIVERKGE